MEKAQFQLEYLKEQYSQARQHETLRTNTTTFLTAATGVVLGFAFKDGIFHPSVSIGLIVTLIGTANYLINEAHFIGNRVHTSVARADRRAMEAAITDWKVDEKPSELREKARIDNGLKKDASVGAIVHRRIQWVPKGVIAVGVLLLIAGSLPSSVISGKSNQLLPDKIQQEN